MANPFNWKNASDSDLEQGMELGVEAAQEARSKGNKKREEAFHQDLDRMLDAAQERGWFGRGRGSGS
ncbi:hypothetical protein [Streptomyces malaysiensis]|uniref:hypothetical protein n=1 Tax=Streptomyces malaysiensis TaxID=92644 RepID=UPI000853BAA9|nr:hypothetical protein [Streptomyces sp. SPMA113]